MLFGLSLKLVEQACERFYTSRQTARRCYSRLGCQTGQKSGQPSERLQGETDLAHLQCFKNIFLAGNKINRLDVILNGFSKQTQQTQTLRFTTRQLDDAVSIYKYR